MGSPGSGRNSASLSIVAAGILSMAALILSAAMPFVARAVIHIFPLTLEVQHSGTVMYNGDPGGDVFSPPPDYVIDGSTLTGATSTWVVTQLQPWWNNAPTGTSAYVLMRVDPVTGYLEGGIPLEGSNYSVVHVTPEFSTSTPNVYSIDFDMPLLGDIGTPSGTYELLEVEEPLTKTVHDPSTGVDTVEPFTDADLGLYLAGNQDFLNDVTINIRADDPIEFTYNAGQAKQLAPTILFIPGIEASDLYDSDGQLWLPRSDADAKQLFMNPDGTSVRSDIYTKSVIGKAYGLLDVYQPFLNDLDSWKNTDHSIADYAVVPYDWRLTLDEILNNGRQLPDGSIHYTGDNSATSTPYILQELRHLTSEGNGKVTIVAHSNGGLVAKALIKKLQDSNDPLLDHIDKLILVGVPQTGTPDAIGVMLHGFSASIPLHLSATTSREFATTSPMAYHLLPSANYFNGNGANVLTPVVAFKAGSTTATFIQTYGQTISNISILDDFLLGEDGRKEPTLGELEQPFVLRSNLLNYGTVVHQQLDSWEPPASMHVYEIAGWGIDTPAGITYQDNQKCLAKFLNGCVLHGATTLMYTPDMVEDGDGTVVTPSALAISTSSPNVTRLWLNLADYNRTHLLLDGPIYRRHFDIFTVPNLRNLVHNLIVGSSSLPEYISSTAPNPLSEKRLRFFLHSPLDLTVVDSSGNETSSSTSAIPGAYYERFGEVQYLSVPASADPTLHLIGEASGSFTLEIQEAQGDIITATTTFMGIPNATTTTALMTFNDGTIADASPLVVDTDGDGTDDLSLQPKIGETVEPDYTPPEFTITFSTSTQSLAFIAVDDSGTATTTTIALSHPESNFGFLNFFSGFNRKNDSKILENGDYSILAKDPSGNTATLKYRLSGINLGIHAGTVALQSIAYNGLSTTTLDSVSLSYVWNDNFAHNQQESLEMTIRNGATTTMAIYDPRKDETTISTIVLGSMPKTFDSFFRNSNASNDRIWDKYLPKTKHLAGLVIPTLQSSKGRLIIKY